MALEERRHHPTSTRAGATAIRSRTPSPFAVASSMPSSPPAWLRTEWSELDIPEAMSSWGPAGQIEWAAKNATVAIHDAFAAGHWRGIADRRTAVYLAICDVVLQRKDQARANVGWDARLPPYETWRAARDADIDEVLSWACRDLQCDPPLEPVAARRLCWGALHAVFWKDATSDPPAGEIISLDPAAIGEFAPDPAVLSRYGLCVLEIAVDNEDDERKVVREYDAWVAQHGPFTYAKGLRGLPVYPAGAPLDPPPLDGTGWRVADLRGPPPGPIPTLEDLMAHAPKPAFL